MKHHTSLCLEKLRPRVLALTMATSPATTTSPCSEHKPLSHCPSHEVGRSHVQGEKRANSTIFAGCAVWGSSYPRNRNRKAFNENCFVTGEKTEVIKALRLFDPERAIAAAEKQLHITKNESRSLAKLLVHLTPSDAEIRRDSFGGHSKAS
jgi:hypothetical protein